MNPAVGTKVFSGTHQEAPRQTESSEGISAAMNKTMEKPRPASVLLANNIKNDNARKCIKKVFYCGSILCPTSIVDARASVMFLGSCKNALMGHSPSPASSTKTNLKTETQVFNSSIIEKPAPPKKQKRVTTTSETISTESPPTQTFSFASLPRAAPVPTPPKDYNQTKVAAQPKDKQSVQGKSLKLADEYLQAIGNPEKQKEISTKFKVLVAYNHKHPNIQKSIEKDQKLAESIAKTFPKEDIKNGLEATINYLCKKYGLSDADIKREAAVIGKDEATAKRKMIQRLMIFKQGEVSEHVSPSVAKRMDSTGYELSTIKAADKAFKRCVLENNPVVFSTAEKGEQLTIVALKETGVTIVGKKLAEGSYKEVDRATIVIAKKTIDEMQKPDQTEFVLVKPKDMKIMIGAKPKMIPTEPSDETSVEAEVQESGTTVYNRGTTVYNEGTTVYNEGTTVYNNAGGKQNLYDPSNIIEAGNKRLHEENKTLRREMIKEFSLNELSTKSLGQELDDLKIELGELKGASAAEIGENKNKIAHLQNLLDKRILESPNEELGLTHMQRKIEILNEQLAHPSNQAPQTKQRLLNEMTKLKELIEKRNEDIQMLKEFKSNYMTDETEYNREIDIALDLQSEYVVKIHSVSDLGQGKFMIQEKAGFEMTKADGTKETFFDLEGLSQTFNRGELTQSDQLKFISIMSDAFKGVLWMHTTKGYIHRDLKGANILIGTDGRGLLSDFGTTAKKEGDINKSIPTGTSLFVAPEVMIHGNEETWGLVDEKSDVWSCGMMLQDLLTDENHPIFEPIIQEDAQLQVNNTQTKKTTTSDDVEENSFDDKVQKLYKQMSEPGKVKAYENSYPEPANRDSLEHLIWSATRVNTNERITMAQFVDRWERLVQSHVDELISLGSP